ncbi:PP2C family protein-serine/threonine phosphatase [Allonocardiopsis opalescens]|uniref:Serine/threonine protein phosphatase PrpC n=1 Tax=Allonocardiopsis opalescens TaxID=1144618 RepID=A0A2T0PW47_9ACTN|nr:protein phosphatase 2C domain-containing protein [Allonocardiopsis opalescens]PRX95759.1 serine/threonine protein phosphatase PrpC [Allonocardiopsis opalescens]
MALTVAAAARTHTGLVRARNEDSCYPGRHLFAVADGLGGHVAGDAASAAVIAALQPYDRAADPSELPLILGTAVHAANDALRDRIDAEPDLAGMGTTLVALLWAETTCVLANVGDCRAYRLRPADDGPAQLTRLTEDHTYGTLLADAATVPRLPERISRFLDGRPDGRSPDITTRELRPGDRYLLCSDGLSAVVPHTLISEALTAPTGPVETTDRLIELALDHGGPDNITALVFDAHQALPD